MEAKKTIKKKPFSSIAIVIFLVVFVLVVSGLFWPYAQTCLLFNREILSKKKWLTSEIDFTEIVSDCRNLLLVRASRVTTVLQGNDPELPKSIRDLEPKYVAIYPTEVWLEFGGGFQHHGIIVTQTDQIAPDVTEDASIVAAGVWYYEHE